MEFFQHDFPAQQQASESGQLGAGHLSNPEQLSDVVSRKGSQLPFLETRLSPTGPGRWESLFIQTGGQTE